MQSMKRKSDDHQSESDIIDSIKQTYEFETTEVQNSQNELNKMELMGQKLNYALFSRNNSKELVNEENYQTIKSDDNRIDPTILTQKSEEQFQQNDRHNLFNITQDIHRIKLHIENLQFRSKNLIEHKHFCADEVVDQLNQQTSKKSLNSKIQDELPSSMRIENQNHSNSTKYPQKSNQISGRQLNQCLHVKTSEGNYDLGQISKSLPNLSTNELISESIFDLQKDTKCIKSYRKQVISTQLTSPSADEISQISQSQQLYEGCSSSQIREVYQLYNWQIEDLQQKLQNVLTENQKLIHYNDNLQQNRNNEVNNKIDGTLHQQLNLTKHQMQELQHKLIEAESRLVDQESSKYATMEMQDKRIDDQENLIQKFIQQIEDLKSVLIFSNLQDEMNKRDLKNQLNQINQFLKKEANYKSNMSMQAKESQHLQQFIEEKRREAQDLIRKNEELTAKHKQQILEQVEQVEALHKQIQSQNEQQSTQRNTLLLQIAEQHQEVENLRKTNKNQELQNQLQSQNISLIRKYEKERQSFDLDIQTINQKLKQLEEVKQDNIRALTQANDSNSQLSKQNEALKQQIREMEKFSEIATKQKYEQFTKDLVISIEQNSYLQQTIDILQVELSQRKQNEQDMQTRIDQIKTVQKFRKTYDFGGPKLAPQITQSEIKNNLHVDYLSKIKECVSQKMNTIINHQSTSYDEGFPLHDDSNSKMNRSISANARSKIDLRSRLVGQSNHEKSLQEDKLNQRNYFNPTSNKLDHGPIQHYHCQLEEQQQNLYHKQFQKMRRNTDATQVQEAAILDFFVDMKFKPIGAMSKSKENQPVLQEMRFKNEDRTYQNLHQRK